MKTRPAVTATGLLITTILLLAIVVGVIVVVRTDTSGEQGSGLPEAFTYDLEQYKRIDPALIRYDQTGKIPVEMEKPRAVAVGLKDQIYLAGDRAVHGVELGGTKLFQVAFEDEPLCLAVGGAHHAFPGRFYVGMRDHVEVYDAGGSRLASWDALDDDAVLTSIAVADQHVFVADAGNRIVWHYDLGGKLLGRIGERDQQRDIPGFVIPSPYFDVAMAPDAALRVVNPGAHRIETYTFEGDLVHSLLWGKSSLAIEGFCGCCNPANIAIFPDGRFVTAEKGIPRVKIYDQEGNFVCVVAGPEILAPTATITEETRADHKLNAVDVAVDSQGRILVLDPAARCIRVFEPKDHR